MVPESSDEHSVITKDKAYLAAGKVLDHLNNLHGIQNQKFLDNNFLKVWEDFDSNQVNFLAIDKATGFMKELIEAGDD